MLKVCWTGAAGVEISLGTKTFLIDPYLSRRDKFSVFFKALVSDRRVLRSFGEKYESGIDGIVVGHTHFDHALDVPGIVPFCRGRVVGSQSLGTLLALHGINKRVDVCHGGEKVDLGGGVSVTMIKSFHGRVMLGRVPWPGEIGLNNHLPMKAMDYTMGTMFMPKMETGGTTILHAGSAGFDMDSLAGHTCDILFMCVPGWQRSPDYVERLPQLVKPGIIVPFHYDDFTRPLGSEPGFPLLPFLQMDGFVRAVSKSFPKADILLLKPHEELLI